MLFGLNGYCQNDALPPNAQVGKCYARTDLLKDVQDGEVSILDSVEFTYLRYIGKDPTVKLHSIDVLVREPLTKWQKIPAKRPCLSRDPNDCLIWCLAKTDPVYKTIRVLKRIKGIPENDFVKENYVKFERTWELFDSGWEEVLCGNDLTQDVCMAINSELNYLGYTSVDSNWDSIEEETKTAILDFQEDSGLPATGNLNIPTIELLGIEW